MKTTYTTKNKMPEESKFLGLNEGVYTWSQKDKEKIILDFIILKNTLLDKEQLGESSEYAPDTLIKEIFILIFKLSQSKYLYKRNYLPPEYHKTFNELQAKTLSLVNVGDLSKTYTTYKCVNKFCCQFMESEKDIKSLQKIINLQNFDSEYYKINHAADGHVTAIILITYDDLLKIMKSLETQYVFFKRAAL